MSMCLVIVLSPQLVACSAFDLKKDEEEHTTPKFSSNYRVQGVLPLLQAGLSSFGLSSSGKTVRWTVLPDSNDLEYDSTGNYYMRTAIRVIEKRNKQCCGDKNNTL